VFGGNRPLALASGAVVFVHFTLSEADYAGVLYVRNITTALLALAWAIALWDRAWATRRRSLVAAGVAAVAMGIAVQNLMTTALTATAVSLALLALARTYRPAEERRTIALVFFGSGAVAFLTAPVWYLLRGSWNEFFSGWFTYARYMSTGTGRSLGAQFSLGWDTFYDYYAHRPLTTVAILAFVAMVVIEWQTTPVKLRIASVGLVAWFAAGWVELVLSQRYSSHYFPVTSLPTALMVAALAARVYRLLVAHRGEFRTAIVWPLAVVLLAVYLFGAGRITDATRDLSAYTSPQANQARVDAGESGEKREARAVLDLVSEEWGPILMWTNDPWPYLDYRRVSATRFIWKAFLTGEIYLGRTGPEYVLPDSWDWFAQDLEQSEPVTYLKSGGGDIPADSPFAKYVADNFSTVYPATPVPVQYRNEVATQILDPATPSVWVPPEPLTPPTGWTAGPGRASYREAGGRDTDELRIANDGCFALTGEVASDGPPGGIVFWFSDGEGRSTPVNLAFDGDHASSASATTEYHRLPTDLTVSGQEPTRFALVVGSRAAAIVVNGRIRAAVHVPERVTVDMISQRGVLDVTSMRTGPAPAVTGC